MPGMHVGFATPTCAIYHKNDHLQVGESSSCSALLCLKWRKMIACSTYSGELPLEMNIYPCRCSSVSLALLCVLSRV